MRGRDNNRTYSDTNSDLVIYWQLTSPAEALAANIHQYPVIRIGGLVVLYGEREVDGGVLGAGLDDDVVQGSASNVGVVDGISEVGVDFSQVHGEVVGVVDSDGDVEVNAEAIVRS